MTEQAHSGHTSTVSALPSLHGHTRCCKQYTLPQRAHGTVGGGMQSEEGGWADGWLGGGSAARQQRQQTHTKRSHGRKSICLQSTLAQWRPTAIRSASPASLLISSPSPAAKSSRCSGGGGGGGGGWQGRALAALASRPALLAALVVAWAAYGPHWSAGGAGSSRLWTCRCWVVLVDVPGARRELCDVGSGGLVGDHALGCPQAPTWACCASPAGTLLLTCSPPLLPTPAPIPLIAPDFSSLPLQRSTEYAGGAGRRPAAAGHGSAAC